MIRGMDRPARLLLPSLALALAALSGCGSEPPATEVSDPPPPAAPSEAPAAADPVATRGPVLVLDQGDLPVMCLAAVADSSPPQCDGQRLEDWSWEEHPEHETQGGVRWGAFALTGTWDGKTLTVTDAVPADEYDVQPPLEESPGTACPPPSGGWTVEDPKKVSSAALDETLRRAGQLPGYAEAWTDTEDITAPEESILNVRVTRDPSGAEAALRKTWGGPLCVQEARYDEDELVELTTDLQELPGVLDTSAWGDLVRLTVVHDDGSYQEFVDATYGEERIEVVSALAPVEE